MIVMRVNINETRRNYAVACIEKDVSMRTRKVAYFFDPVTPDTYICLSLRCATTINYIAVFD